MKKKQIKYISLANQTELSFVIPSQVPLLQTTFEIHTTAFALTPK